MKNETTFVRMRSGGHCGDPCTSKKAPDFFEVKIENNNCRHLRFWQNERKREDKQPFTKNFQFLSKDLAVRMPGHLTLFRAGGGGGGWGTLCPPPPPQVNFLKYLKNALR